MAEASKKVYEYRGVEGLVFARVTEDSAENYTTGDVKPLCPVAEIGKTTESDSEAHYYDNKPAIVINAEGPDEISIVGAGMDLETLAEITGKTYNPNTGAYVDSPREERYFALGYKTKDSDGKYRYVWRYKGTFSIPDDNIVTENDGTDANGTELTFTGIYTTHVFAKGGYDGTKEVAAPAKGLVVSDREDKADLASFFATVTTPDTLKAKTA